MQSWPSFLILFSCLTLLCCETTPASTDNNLIDSNSENGKINYTYLADKFCTCAQNSIKINIELESLKKNQDLDLLIERLPEAEKAFKEVIACCENILLNHTTKKILPEKMNAVLERKCEKLAPRLRKDLIDKLPH